jgi:hypothetical protein
VPTSGDAAKNIMRTAISDVIVPAAKAEREEVVQQQAQRAQLLKETPPDPSLPPRVVLSFDGERSHLDANLEFFQVDDADLPDDAKRAGFELLKFAASASNTQQPCDAGPCFKTFKRDFRESKHAKARAEYSDILPPLFKDMDKGSRETFIDFLEYLPQYLDDAFQARNVLLGWENTGLCPFDPEKIMSRCTTWELLTKPQADAVLAAVEKLKPCAVARGEVTDQEMQDAVGGVLNLAAWLDTHAGRHIKVGKPLEEQAINRRRAVWVNNKEFLARWKADLAAKAAAKAKKAAPVAAAQVAPAAVAAPKAAKKRAAPAATVSNAQKKPALTSAAVPSPAPVVVARGLQGLRPTLGKPAWLVSDMA